MVVKVVDPWLFAEEHENPTRIGIVYLVDHGYLCPGWGHK